MLRRKSMAAHPFPPGAATHQVIAGGLGERRGRCGDRPPVLLLGAGASPSDPHGSSGPGRAAATRAPLQRPAMLQSSPQCTSGPLRRASTY